MEDKQVAVFARVPVRGMVKTRLAREIGDSEALRVYSQLLEDALSRLEQLDCPVLLYADGLGLEDVSRQFGMDARVQKGTGLGMRMANAFDEMLRECGAAAIVGVDVPLLDADYVKSAFEMLTDSDVVLGPTEDGGYCLIAMKQLNRDLFNDISWGSSKVYSQTMSRAMSLALTVACVETLWDVDDAMDLKRLATPIKTIPIFTVNWVYEDYS